jgi:hypothetical protein
MKKLNHLFFFFTILVLNFLGSTSHPLSQEVKFENNNDVIVVSNSKTSRQENGIPIRLVFEEELSIGAEYGNEEYMFGNRVYFNVDFDGNYYVNDWDKRCLC